MWILDLILHCSSYPMDRPDEFTFAFGPGLRYETHICRSGSGSVLFLTLKMRFVWDEDVFIELLVLFVHQML